MMKHMEWRVVPEGMTADGRPTHDEDTGELVVSPHRGRHIVDANGRVVCEFVHDEGDAHLMAAAPMLLAALESCVEQILQMRGMFDDSDGAIEGALEDAMDAIARTNGGRA